MIFRLDFSKNIFIQSMSPIENLKQRGIKLPLITYKWFLASNQDGTRTIIDQGDNPKYNAEMFTGQGVYFNGIDQNVSFIPTSLYTIYTFNGIMHYISGALDLSQIVPVGTYQNIIYLDFDLTQTQKDYYLSNPETFLYRENEILKSTILSQTEIDNIVAYLPICEKDEYIRDLVNYSEANISVVSDIDTGWTDNGDGSFSAVDAAKWSEATKNSGLASGYYLVSFEIDSITSGSVQFDNGVDAKIKGDSIGSYSGIIYSYGLIKMVASDAISTTATISNLKIDYISGVYPIQNYTTACRDNAKNLNKGLQSAKWQRDSLGVPIGLSEGVEGDKIGNIVIPVHTETVNIDLEVYPREVVGNILSGNISLPASGLIQNQWNTITLNNQSVSGAITLLDGFNGTIRKYTETKV